jgi:hypothetical protein
MKGRITEKNFLAIFGTLDINCRGFQITFSSTILGDTGRKFAELSLKVEQD